MAAVGILGSECAAQGSLALVGGGAESSAAGSWSQEPYSWMVERSGFGAIVVLGTEAASQWLPDYFVALGAASAVNLTIPDRLTADAESTAAAITEADGVFIRGGDQWEYVRLWQGTRTAAAIRQLFADGGVVAGTSAGAMVLSDVVFDARHGTVYPEETLADPFVRYVSFTDDFLDLLPNTLVDTHFTGRGRLGRLVPMIARWQQEHGDVAILGLGIDTQTALLVTPEGHATVAGEGSVAVIRTTGATRQRLVPGAPPVITDVRCDLMTEGFELDTVTGQVAWVPLTARQLSPVDRPASGWAQLVLDGGDQADSLRGQVVVDSVHDDRLALQAGALTLAEGDGMVPTAIIVPAAWDDPDLTENRVGGLLWGLSERPGFLGLLLTAGNTVEVRPDRGLRPAGSVAALAVDSRSVTVADQSRWVVFDDSTGPRQSVALLGLRVHLLADGWLLNGAVGTVHERIVVGRAPMTLPVSGPTANSPPTQP